MKYLLTAVLMFSTYVLGAQSVTDTLHTLKEVSVTARRDQPPLTGSLLDTIDSRLLDLYSSSSVADFISTSGQVFVKSYGPGTLSSISLNGTSAMQTSILWNGFKIESPMLGQTDAGLLPSCFVDDIVIQSGGRSDLWGSASMGGSILLNNNPDFNSGISVSLHSSLASFNDRFYSSQVKYGSKKVSGSVSWFNHSSENNYIYHNFFGKEVERKNASFKEQGILSTNYFSLANHTVNINAWLQQNIRHLPSSVTEAPGVALQKDNAARATAAWQYSVKNFLAEIRSGINSEQLVYENVGSDSSDFFTASNHGETRWLLKHNQFIIAFDYDFTKAHEHYYSTVPEQNLIASFLSWKRDFAKIKLVSSLSAREERVNGENSPITPSLGLEKKLPLHFKIFFSTSRVYRNTTFNERYWQPGGNPDLLPESGWSYSASVQNNLAYKSFGAHTSLTFFDNRIKNQIVWMGGSYYSPVNVNAVHSNGVTVTENLTLKIRSFDIDVSGTYSYVKSINTEVAANQQTSLGKQSIYTPEHQGAVHLFLSYKNILVSYEQSFTGACYVQSDNLDSLPPYAVANACASYSYHLKNFSFEFQLKVKNIFNQDYYVINYFPMPLRTCQLSLILKFNSKNQSQ